MTGAKLRVAAYCRVSTSQDDQRNSLENQRRYFAEYIGSQPDWELARVYADEGLSGTAARNRPAFQQMLSAAEEGEIDLILTKEVSRFARNTVDALACTRRLRRYGVGVVFINDGIDTRQNDGEFRLTIMASVAQEESRKTSERVKWGQRRSMENGVVFGCNNIYGFSLLHGRLTVKEDEAEVIRLVYRKFLNEGKGTFVIARELSESGVEPPRAKGKPWSSTMVLRLLRNEKYCGDLLQKKSYTPDFLDHKKQVNRGEEEQIYLRDHHEPIVPRAVFEQAQQELARRASAGAQGRRCVRRYWCSGKLICAACGRRFVPRRRRRAGGEVYRYWVCAARGRHGPRHTDGRETPDGCDMRMMPHQALCTCMDVVVERLGLDVGRLIRETAELVEQAEDGGVPVALERLQERRQRVLQRRGDALDAWLGHSITKEELDSLRARYDAALARLDGQERTLEAQWQAARTGDGRTALRAFLETEALRCEAVYGELLEQMRIGEGGVLVRLRGLAVTFRLQYAPPRRGAGLRPEDIRCTLLPDT